MSSSEPKYQKEWRRDDGYLISTDPSLVSISALISAFGQGYMYWCKPLPEPEMRKMVDSSLNFGLYRVDGSSNANPLQIGFARIVTDHVTFAYLSDVYVLPEYRRHALGSWLIGCVREFLQSMPHLRRAVLMTSGHGGVEYYKRALEMEVTEGELKAMSYIGPGAAVLH